MKARMLALFAVLALGLVPALAAAVTPTPTPGSPVVLVKAYSTVTAVTDTTVTLKVEEAHEWVDGTETKTLATGINGQEITAAINAETAIYKGEMKVDRAALVVGTKVKAIMQSDGTPVTPTCTFTLREAFIEVPKVHPADKFEFGFFHRLWHARGQILGLDQIEGRNVMNLDVRRVENAPKRFRDESVRLINMDAYVIVPPKVVITDADGDRISFAQLDVDDRVKVVVKAVAKERWLLDEEGHPTPTLLAKRIKVRD